MSRQYKTALITLKYYSAYYILEPFQLFGDKWVKYQIKEDGNVLPIKFDLARYLIGANP